MLSKWKKLEELACEFIIILDHGLEKWGLKHLGINFDALNDVS